ncbi:MAG TPA: hypothetical protein PKD55_10190 [Bellilinea sp.]|nr:hypothetical protein [Bellilinea sp.]
MHWIEVANELESYLRRGDLAYCINHVSQIIRTLPNSPFHHVLEVDFTNDPVEVAGYFDRFVVEQRGRVPFAAIYTETNGFYINPDLWFFDIFLCPTYGGHDNYNWLSDCRTYYEPSITLTGMESLQAVYQRIIDSGVYDNCPPGSNPEVERLQVANEFSDLLVVLRFQDLIRRSASHMQQVKVPVLATSHEFDFIYEVDPSQS